MKNECETLFLIFLPLFVNVNLNRDMSFSEKCCFMISFSNNSSSNISFNSPFLLVVVFPPDNRMKSLRIPSNFNVGLL